MVKKIKTEFEKKLSDLCAAEIERTWDKPHEFGMMIENLSFALSYSLCLGYRAEAKEIDKAELMIEHYLQETIDTLLPLAKEWVKNETKRLH